jgi:Tol biopolymer transport system component
VAAEVAGVVRLEDRTSLAGTGGMTRLTTVLQSHRHGEPLSVRSARVSASGRHVVFTSSARLTDADVDDFADVYVVDLETRQITLETAARGEGFADGWSQSPDISGDGRFVVFESAAGNLTDRELPWGTEHVFLRDRTMGTTDLLTSNAYGGPANGASRNPVISADGRTVVFESWATDLVEKAGADRASGIYLIDRASGRRSRVDVSSAGEPARAQSMAPAVSADGRFVAFVSRADLTCRTGPACSEPSDRNGVADIYVRDTKMNSTTRITRGHARGDTDGPSYHPAISGDGRYVAFVSDASNLPAAGPARKGQIYLHDLFTGVTGLVSRTPGGRPANGPGAHPALSHDGSRIAFQSLASDLVCEKKCPVGTSDYNLLWDVFVHDRSTRRTTRASADADGDWMETSRGPSLNAAGTVVAFGSRHPLGEDDTADDEDLYVLLVAPSPTAVDGSRSGVVPRR